MEIHAIIRGIDEFLYEEIRKQQIDTNNPPRKADEEPPGEKYISDNIHIIKSIIDNGTSLIDNDPYAYNLTLPDNATNWSLAMMAWLMVAKATILCHRLYRLHPSYRISRLRPNNQHASRSGPFFFLSMKTSLLTTESARKPPVEFPPTAFSGIARYDPFKLKYMASMMDSEYLCACGVVVNKKPILSFTLTELMTQIKTIHAMWPESIRYHPDIGTALKLLEMRAMMLASMPWKSDVLDIEPMTVSHNIATGGGSSMNPDIFSLTRGLNPTPKTSSNNLGRNDLADRAKAKEAERRNETSGKKKEDPPTYTTRITSHRFVFEMQTFFMTCRLHLSLHDLFPHASINVLGIPGWHDDPNDRGKSWDIYQEELEVGNPSLLADISRESMANLFRVLNQRPCEKDFYNKALKIQSDVKTQIMQLWYEFRPGSAISRTLISFAANWIGYNRYATKIIPNPKYKWKELPRPSPPEPVNQPRTAPKEQPRVISRHTAVRDVLLSKLGGLLINSYLPAEASKAINWEQEFFIAANDLIYDPKGILITDSDILRRPIIVYMMNEYYLYLTLKINGTLKPYFIDTPDMMSAIYAWIYAVKEYHDYKLFGMYDLTRLCERIFSGGPSKNFTPTTTKEAVLTKSTTTEGENDTENVQFELMAALM